MHLVVRIAQRPIVCGLASPVVGVDALGGVPIESFHGFGQTSGIDSAHVGETVECPCLLQHAALEELARESTGAGALVRVALAIAIVEDQPAGNRSARLVAGG